MQVKWLALVAFLVGSSAHASPDFDVRGVSLGDSFESLKQAHPDVSCSEKDGVVADTLCFLRGFGSAPDAFVAYVIVSGEVESIRILFDSSHYGSVSLAMKSKFGEGNTTTSSIQNAMGTSFPNSKTVWLTSTQRLTATEREGRVDRSAVTLESMDGIKAANQRFKAATEADASKL